MGKLTAEDAVALEVPPAMRDRYVVRVLDKKFGPNSKGNPMVTVNWEIAGIPNKTGGVDTVVEKNGKKYQVAGIRLRPTWFTLTPGRPLESYIQFFDAANGQGAFKASGGVDPENPDTEWIDGLVMEAILIATEQTRLKELSDEEKAEKRAKNEPLIGEPILDGDGKEMKTTQVQIDQRDGGFIRKFTGDVPEKPF
jgi:hypothetical protein